MSPSPSHNRRTSRSHQVAGLAVGKSLLPQLFHGNGDADSIADFVDAHLLEDGLVAVEQIVAIEVVCFEKAFILPTTDTM
jgi:hypothetical protein